jgi:hypothetical protein
MKIKEDIPHLLAISSTGVNCVKNPIKAKSNLLIAAKQGLMDLGSHMSLLELAAAQPTPYFQ